MTRPPYPGLRSFKREETDLFFGREANIDAIINRLGATRFVTVLGASGSGKSSLVRTGVLDALTLGLLADAGSSWLIVDLHPGDSPMANLARALIAGSGKAATEEDVAAGLAALRRGPRSVVEWAKSHRPAETNLLLLVDQFEELFRYDSYATREEAQAFVNLLLESARQRDQPIYVLLTMRSEYLGACALLDGLAEAINRGQYLTPRLMREQCRAAIEGPAAVCDIEIEPALVNRLLNDLAVLAPFDENEEREDSAEAAPPAEKRFVGGVSHLDQLARRADQLPLMQHVLNRLWTSAAGAGGPVRLTLEAYDQSGGLRGSLSAHAEEIMASLVAKHGEAIRSTVETVFRALVTGGSVSDAVRRPTTMAELVALAGGGEAGANVRLVVDAFRAPGCNFLMPDLSMPLVSTTVVDISHESLIRQWATLSTWTEKEADAAAWWHRLLEIQRAGSRLRGAPLASNLQLVDEYRPTAAWAARHGDGFDAVMAFLKDNKEREERAARTALEAEARERARRQDIARARTNMRRVAVVALILIVAVVGLFYQKEELKEAWNLEARARDDAVRAQAIAEEKAREARDESIQAALERIAGQIQSLQSQSRWGDADAAIAKLVGRLVQSEANKPTLAKAISDPLTLALGFSWHEGRSESSRAVLGNENTGRITRLTTVTDDGNGMSLIAGARNDRIVAYGRTGNGDWESFLDRDRSDERTTSGRVRGIAFYNSGKRLALFLEREIRLGTLQEFQDRKTQQFSLSVANANVNGDRPIATPGASPQRNPQSSGQIATLLNADGMRFVGTCHPQEPMFLLLDDKQRLWRISVTKDGLDATPLTQKPVTHVDIDESSGLYAFVERDRAEEVRIAYCESDANGQQRVQGPLRIARGIQAIKFAPPGELGVVDRQDGISFFRRRDDGAFFRIDSGKIRDGYRFLGFGGVDLVWERLGAEGRLVELRNLVSGKVERIVVFPSTGDFRAIVPGANKWIATLASADGKLSVYQPMPPPPSEATIAAIISITADPIDTPPELARRIDDVHSRLETSGQLVRATNTPQRGPPADCQQALDTIIGVFERVDPEDHNPLEPKALLEGLANVCKASGAEYAEAALLSTLLNYLKSRPDGVTSLEVPDNVIRVAAVLASRGSSFGMRLLALDLANDGFADAARAVQLAAANKGAPLPYSLLALARKSPGQLAPHFDRLVALRENSNDGRDHELLAIARETASRRGEALVHAVLANRYYAEAGDRRSARIAAALMARLGRQVSEEDALKVWQRLRALDGSPSAPKAPVVPVITVPRIEPLTTAFGTVADGITGPMASAEFLIYAGLQVASYEKAGAARLLKRGVAAAPPLGAGREKDVARLLAKAARTLDSLAEGQFATGTNVDALSLLDAIKAKSDTNAPADTEAAAAITELLVRLEKAPITDPLLREKLDGLSWRFVQLTWGGYDDPQAQLNLLEAALKLQNAQLGRGAASAELRFAKASTLFWLAVLGGGRQREPYLRESVTLFDQVAAEAGRGSADRRLRHADAIRWLASTGTDTTLEARRERIRGLVAARDLYESLLPDIAKLKDDDYVRPATISGLSSVYDSLANQWAWVAAMEYATSRHAMDTVADAALSSMRAVYAHQSLYAQDRFGTITAGVRNRDIWFFRAPERHEDAWMVGLITGAIELEKARAEPGVCERGASNQFDPRRSAPGGSAAGLIRDLSDLRRICEGERESRGDSTGLAYLIGRLYSVTNADIRENAEVGLERRTKALRHLLQAARDGYPFAFYGIYAAATDEYLSPLCRRHLMTRYRHLVLRGHLDAVLPVLEKARHPDDKAMLDWLKEGAISEPTETTRFLKENKDLDLDWLRKSCGFKG